MLKNIRRTLATLVSVAMFASLALPGAVALADNSGTLNVVVSPEAGSYEVLNDVTGAVAIATNAGSHVYTLAAGDYRVDFKPLAGYTTPAFQTFTMVPGGITTVTGLYTESNPLNGVLNVVVNPSNGKFEVKNDVTGAIVFSEHSGSQTLTLPFGDYAVVFKDLTGYTTPATVPFTLDASNTEFTATGEYTLPSTVGTITVVVSPAAGRFEIKNDVTGAVVVTERAGSSAFTLPFGDYIVVFKDLPLYTTPASVPFTLDASHNDLTVNGSWTLSPTVGTLTVNVTPAAGSYEILNDVTGAVVAALQTGSSTQTLSFGDYRVTFKALAGYVTPADQFVTLSLANPVSTVSGIYNTVGSTGAILVNVTKQDNSTITNGDWTLNSCTGATLATCTTFYANGTESTPLTNVPAGTYGLTFKLTAGYTGASVLSLNPQTVTTGNLTTFDLQYFEAATTGTIQVNVRDSNGAQVTDGRWTLNGPTTLIGFATQTVTGAVGSYTLTATVPAGNTRYTGVSVSPASLQTLTSSAPVTFDVTYTLAPIVTTGGITVNQNGSVGDVTVYGPNAYTHVVSTPTFNDPAAQPGIYTLAITDIVAGYELIDVRDALNNVLIAPYTQTLGNGGSLVWNVNTAYAAQRGTIQVNQSGAVGIFELVGPSMVLRDNAAFMTMSAGIGTYSMILTAPTGFQLRNVTNGSNQVLTLPYTQTLAATQTITYNLNWIPVTTTGSIAIHQTGGIAQVSLEGPSPALVITDNYSNARAQTGTYNLSLQIPNFYALVDVRDATGALLSAPYNQTLTTGGNLVYDITLRPTRNIGWMHVRQIGAVGSVQVLGPTPATVTVTPYDNPLSVPGNYTLGTITPPAGFALQDVRDQSGTLIVAPYAQTLDLFGGITYTVTYAPVLTNTVTVNQVGGIGTLNLIDPAAAITAVTTATRTISPAALGNWTLGAITAPAGLFLGNVTDGAGNVLAGPSYAQTLVAGTPLVFNVNYVAANSVTVNQIGAVGTLNLIDPAAAATAVATATHTVSPAALGSWTLGAIVPPAGFVLASVTDAAGTAVTPAPFAQTLAAGQALVFNINYVAATANTVTVNQVGGIGTLNLIDPALAPTAVATATRTVNAAAAGSWTLGAIVPPAGMFLGNVTDNLGNVLAGPSYAQTLVAGGALTFNVNYVPANSVTVNQIGAVGTLNLIDPALAPTAVITATRTLNAAAAGSWTLGAIVPPAGFVLASVTNAAGTALTPAPYAQTLVAGQALVFNVNYVAATANTVTVNQIGGVGSLNLIDPAAAATSIVTATRTVNAVAGSWTLGAIVPPAGMFLGNVTDNLGNVLAGPSYAQTLVAGGALTFNVNYVPANSVTVNQIGAVGTLNLIDPAAAATAVITATRTVSPASAGAWTLGAIVPPAGFVLASVTDAAGTAVTPAPYAQTLVAGQALVFNVNYALNTNIPDPAIATFALAVASANPTPGATVTYQINFSNLSATTSATGVTLDITYNTTLGTVIVPVGCTDSVPAGTLHCTEADLAANGTGTRTFGYTINATTAIGASITHTVRITGANGNGNAANDTGTVTTVVGGAFTLTKTANAASVNDNGLITYTIRITRNVSQVLATNVTLRDTVTGTGVINGTPAGQLIVIPNNGTCVPAICTGATDNNNLDVNNITVALTNANPTATLTYQVRANNTNVPASNAVATNTVTATPVGFPVLTATSNVTLIAPAGNNNNNSGPSGSTSGTGGGYKLIKGDMKLEIRKLVSLDGVNYVEADPLKSLALAIPENKATRVYTKVLIGNLGKVSAANLQFRYFFNSGKSDMTADGLDNLAGAHVNAKGLLIVDKILVGGTAEMSYNVLVHENGKNANPAVDGLELVSFGSNLPSMQDGLTYLGFGTQNNTYLYAGTVPANAEGKPVTLPESAGTATLAINVHANKPTANIGDTVTFVATLRNLSNKDLTNLLVEHTFDANAFEVADTFGATTDGNSIRWKQPILRPGQQVNLSFNLKVKDSAPVGALVQGLTQVLTSEFDNLAPFQNSIRIGAAGQQMELAQTGPASLLALLTLLSALATYAFSLLKRAWQLRNRRLALQAI